MQAETGLKFPETLDFLARAQKTLETSMSDMEDTTGTNPQPDATSVASAPASSSAARPTAASTNGSLPVTISSRSDVEKCLEGIIAFYEGTEPSSPIPHLARRMRRMVPMDFLELMEEIAPSGMKEFRSVAGVDEAKKKPT